DLVEALPARNESPDVRLGIQGCRKGARAERVESAGIVFDFDRRVHHRRRALRGVAFEIVPERDAGQRASGLAARAKPRGRVELHLDSGRQGEVYGVQERGLATLVVPDETRSNVAVSSAACGDPRRIFSSTNR